MDEVLKAQLENHDERIKKLESSNDSNKEILIELKIQQKYILESITSLTTAVNALEKKPVKEFNSIKLSVVTGIVTFLFTSAAAYIATKLF